MADRLPLTEVSGAEILARVTYQIILGDYLDNPEAYDHPEVRLFDLAFQWHQSGIQVIAEELDLAAIWCAQGGQIRAWLTSRITYRTGRPTILAGSRRSRNR